MTFHVKASHPFDNKQCQSIYTTEQNKCLCRQLMRLLSIERSLQIVLHQNNSSHVNYHPLELLHFHLVVP